MKRVVCLALVLCLLLAACGKVATSDLTAEELAQLVLDSQLDPEGLSPLPAEELEGYLTGGYGLQADTYADAAVYAAAGADAREVAVIRLASEEEAEAASHALEEYLQGRKADFFGYFPAQTALLEGAAVVRNGNVVALLVCEDVAGATSALEKGMDGAVTVLATLTPSPAPTASATGAPSPDPPPELEEPSPEPNISEFKPFQPPQKVHMEPYDTTLILAAWESGDESALSEKDAAILARCREGIETCLTEGMTDFQKELALYDWMLLQFSYDEAAFDPRTPEGREDNGNPYGALVGGYATCLGYTTTFQLLMDLADVECTTIIGASSDSTMDHAWNMVKLDGEWYCVDTTWYAPEPWIKHGYFNVTSDYMRGTNHQWDYLGVPEATATKYHWNGMGQPPNN